MTEPVVFPDIEALLVSYLRPLLDRPVVTRVPNPRPAEFVRVVRVGGTRRDRVTDLPLVVFEAWAENEEAAAGLGTLVRAYVFALEGAQRPEGFVRSVKEVGGLQSYPDPTSETPRYQFTAQLQTRGEPLT